MKSVNIHWLASWNISPRKLPPAHCDAKDGVLDGVISDVASCNFDPFSVVNTSFACHSGEENRTLTQAAALVADAFWTGPRNSAGEPVWHGFDCSINITDYGYAANETNKTSNARKQNDYWLKFWLAKDTNFDSPTLTHEQWDEYWKRGIKFYEGIISTDNPDLSDFKNAGGKMITWHGTSDEDIQYSASVQYYYSVSKLFPDEQDFCRFFTAPGVAHCYRGLGETPTTTFDALRAWVENGTAPQTLPVKFNSTIGGVEWNRTICLYPLKQVYKGAGDPASPDSFSCE